MSRMETHRQGGLSGTVCVVLLLVLQLMVSGGTSAKSENTSAEQAEANAAFLEMLAKWQAVRTPSRGHELLAKLVGQWDVTLVFHGGKGRWESKCMSECTLLHGGRFLLEQITGEIYAPDEKGRMRPEPYTATRLLGYDNYKKAYVGAFAENQHTYLLTFQGHARPGGAADQVPMFGLCDEPMQDLHDATMKYILRLEDEDNFAWEVYALAVGDDAKVFDFVYTRRNTGR